VEARLAGARGCRERQSRRAHQDERGEAAHGIEDSQFGYEYRVLPEPLASELLATPLIANLGTFNADGTIHLVAIWFSWDGETLFMPTAGSSRKARNLERDPRATVMLHDSRGGLDVRGLTMVGRAEILRGEQALALNHRVHLRYVTERGLAIASVGDFLTGDDVTLCFTPERATSWGEGQIEVARELRESGEFTPPFLGP
jgi:hypothetical protein